MWCLYSTCHQSSLVPCFFCCGVWDFFLRYKMDNCAEVILNTKTSEIAESSCRVLSLLVVRVK